MAGLDTEQARLSAGVGGSEVSRRQVPMEMGRGTAGSCCFLRNPAFKSFVNLHTTLYPH